MRIHLLIPLLLAPTFALVQPSSTGLVITNESHVATNGDVIY